MKVSTFIKHAELTKRRFSKLSELVIQLETVEQLTPTQVQLLKTYEIEVVKKFNDFNANLDKLVNTEPLPEDYDDDTVCEWQNDVSDLHNDVMGKIQAMIHNISTITTTSSGTISSVRLPKLSLPEFSGETQTWLSFHGLFVSTIHKNAALTPLEKFQYLLSSLRGEALGIIKSLPITASNYTIAWELLEKRYHNTRRLVNFHINNILDLPVINNLSPKHIRNFVSVFAENQQALAALNHDLAPDSILLANLLTRKLDLTTRKKFEDSRGEADNIPDIKDLMKFLETECRHLEDANMGHVPNQKPTFQKANTSHTFKHDARSGPSHKTAFVTTSKTKSNPVQCWACQENTHTIYNCSDFQKRTPQERHALVKSKGYCYNCLSNLHMLKSCKSTRTCNKCHHRHHTLLHLDPLLSHNTSDSEPQTASSAPGNNRLSTSPNTFVGISANRQTSVLLATIVARLSMTDGVEYVARGILDSAAQSSFVSDRLVQLMGIQRWHTPEEINGVASSRVKTKGLTYLNLSSTNGNVVAELHPFTILNDITSFLPHCKIASDVKNHLKGLALADPLFDIPGPIDFLIGADLYGQIFTGHRHAIGSNFPVAFSTVFGYVLMGPAPIEDNGHQYSKAPVALLSTSSNDVLQSLQQFWEIEEVPSAPKMSPDETRCEEHFSRTHSRDCDGRYMVKLPLKVEPPPLADSRTHAEHQFKSLERRMISQPHFKQMYAAVIHDYTTSNHMERVASSHEIPARHYFLPHHGVLKDSSSTPLRIVFNASAKTSNSYSLNDCLSTGPKLQTNLVDVVTHFRRHQIAFISDIKQMYRQIMVHPEDQYLQLLVWRDEPKDPIQVYKLTRVVFGMASSPFLALRCLGQLITDEGQIYPQAVEILQTCTFVDDILGGASTVQEALILQQQLTTLLLKGGFELRKWASNSTQFLESLPEGVHDTPITLAGPEQASHSILGLQWDSKSDTFTYKVRTLNASLTKRSILSSVAKLYDPCGWLAPVTLWAKSLIQQLWTLGLSWDEEVPQDIAKGWSTFSEELPQLANVTMDRLINVERYTEVELHGFGDASESGYAAVIYLRSCSVEQEAKVNLLMAKSRVAPLKHLSIPRLELCAAHMVAKLLHYCSDLITPYCKSLTIYAWSDSTIALTWIRTPSYRLKVFVANRVADIQGLVAPHHWLHVSSSENPADCASRGVFPSELLHHHLWWTGPKWLVQPQELRPISAFSCVSRDNLPEQKPESIHGLVVTTDNQIRPLDMLLDKYSSWRQLVRVFAYIRRFINNCRTSSRTTAAYLSCKELHDATLAVCRLVQEQCFPKELTCLRAGKSCDSKLQRLAPFLDGEVIRVGGRLQQADIHFNSRHPILLPKSHHVVTILIDYYHLKYLHAGPQLVQAGLCEQFWILNARNQIRLRIFKCLTCFRNRSQSRTPFMGDLPKTRVIPSRPFSRTGMDYAGPFRIKTHRLRRTQFVKAYLCIFVCFVTKSVHIETVTDLTTDAFIAALTRFVSRRGLCSDLYSDCGTNFVGAANQLRRTFHAFFALKENQMAIEQFANQSPINFHFLPPAAPHMGGLWESAVKSAKHHLTRVLGQYVPTLEEFITLSTRVEAMLNSRPLTPLSSDPHDLGALTPGHFLIGTSLVAVPELDRESLPINRLTRWQTIEAFSQRIWHRWQREYLHTLQQRGKWTQKPPNLKVGDLVLVHDHRMTSMHWPLGRIASTSPGKDGTVRVVTVRTATGPLTRPVVKVFPLPTN